MHAPDTNSDNDSMSDDDDDSLKRRRDLLTRRPSYHRILKDITGPDIAGNYKCKHCRFSLLSFSLVGFYHNTHLPMNTIDWHLFSSFRTMQYFHHQRFNWPMCRVPMVYIRYKQAEVAEQSCNMRHKIQMDNFSYLVRTNVSFFIVAQINVHPLTVNGIWIPIAVRSRSIT